MGNSQNRAMAILSEIKKHPEDARGLFRALLAVLPGGQRLVLEAIASHPKPVLARELASELGITVHIVSTMVLRLKVLSLVEVERKGRDAWYSLPVSVRASLLKGSMSIKSTDDELEAIELDFIFDDWRDREGQSVYGKAVDFDNDLSTGQFHSGTTYRGILLMDKGAREQLVASMKQGFAPAFYSEQARKPPARS